MRSCRNGGQENCRGFVISTHVEFVEQPTYWIGFNVLGFGHVETDISKLILLWRLHLAIPGNFVEFALLMRCLTRILHHVSDASSRMFRSLLNFDHT